MAHDANNTKYGGYQEYLMDLMNTYYPESRFGGFTDIDGTIAFYVRVNSLVKPSSVVLDIGCGRGAYAEDTISIRRNLRVLKGKCKEVIGTDVARIAQTNPFLDEFRLMEDESGPWPVDDDSMDVCICDSVLEHVADPVLFFSECRRVIRMGGYLCVRTPNILSYVALFSRLIPNRYHAATLKKVQLKRKEADVFPTLYRCNTTRKLRYMLDKYGFDHCVYGYEAEPSYASFSRFFYFLATIHQRIAPSPLKAVIFAFGCKVRGD